jgi:predicted phosphodiesterase
MRVDAIFLSDVHIMERVPLCRTDNFLNVIVNKMEQLKKVQEKYRCPIFIGGDIFDVSRMAKASDVFWIKFFESFKNKIIAIPGQHDIPNHNIEKIFDSSLGVIDVACENFSLIPLAFEQLETFNWKFGGIKRKIGMIHKLFHHKKEDIIKDSSGNKLSSSAKVFLRKHLDCDVILSGDNHKTFVVEYENKILINPGSVFRMRADQIDHRPCVFLYDAEKNKVTPEYFQIKEDVVTREHLEKKEDRQDRMDAYINKLNEEENIGISFSKNLENIFKINKIEKAVQNKIWNWREE